jgi:hypothetical protein
MAKKSKIKIDSKKFIEMVKEGHSKKDIMDAFGIKTYTQFDTKYNQAAIEMGLIPALKRTRGTKDGNVVKVRKTGSLTIPKELVSEAGYKENDEFDVKTVKDGFSLKVRKKEKI